MNSSNSMMGPGLLLEQMKAAAIQQFGNLGTWARAAGVPKETLSRLKSQASCDLRTLSALAAAAGYVVTVVPVQSKETGAFPETLTRELESQLLDLAASGNTDQAGWLRHGSPFFMGGFAVLLAGARSFDREKYLRLAESLHSGVTIPEVFGQWLRATPVRAARFLPMARKRKGFA